MFEDFHVSSILVATIRSAPVLLFAAFAGVFAERSGIIDLALEGKMLVAAFAAAACTAAITSGCAWPTIIGPQELM